MAPSSSRGVALLIAGYGMDEVVNPTSLIRSLGQIGEALLVADSTWRVNRLALGETADRLPDQTNLERQMAAMSAQATDVALVVFAGRVTRLGGGPALVMAPRSERAGTAGSLPLPALGAVLRASRPARVAIVLAGWSDPAADADDAEELEREWSTALATGRPDDLIATGAGARATRVIEALRDGLTGDAVDERTGTITLRSLASHLAQTVPGLAVQAPAASDTITTPPPLTSRWDTRLTRRSRQAASPAPHEPAAPDALVGTILPGRFRIDGLIARGGFGAVYRARQLSVDRDVALKVLHAEVDPASAAGRLFVHEIRSIGGIDHPNVVRIYQADVMLDGRLFFAMELLQGRDLEQVIQADGKLGIERSLSILDQLLAGLGAAHEAGVIHADLKPANVLLVPGRTDERVVLVDFGLSRLRAPDQPVRSLGGTPAYMAPEQLRNGRVDARSDLFSAALVLVTLLTGWRRQSRDALVPPVDEIAEPALRACLHRALALDPAERFETAAELADALTGRARTRRTVHRALTSLPALVEVMSDRLYGRDRDIESLVDHVLYRRALVLAGGAGIGKTTLLRRGAIPRLGALRARVVYVACRPGTMAAAAAAIAHEIDPTTSDLVTALTHWHAQTAGKLILILDQLELLVRKDAHDLDELIRDLLAPDRWPAGSDLAVIACVRTPCPTRLRIAGTEAGIMTLGLLTDAGAREAIAGPLAELRLQIDDDLLALVLRDLTQAAPHELRDSPHGCVYPPQLQRACAALYDVLHADEVRLTRAHYERAGGAASFAEPRGAESPSRSYPARRRVALVSALVLLGGAAVALGIAARHGTDTQGTEAIVVGGSGTVLFGFLQPVRRFLEERSRTSIPIESKFDLGSGGAMRSLRSGEIDVAALSTRFEQVVPADLRAADKLMVEVPVGFDETALFVRRENPLRQIDIAAIQAHLCCGHDQRLSRVTWTELGLSAPPFAQRSVGWTLFGRTGPPLPRDSTSSTLLQADVWLCAPRQLCPTQRPVDVEANEVLSELATDADVLALSTRAFGTDHVVPLLIVDGQHRTRLDGRKVLWLYLALPRARPIPARLCRFLDAILDPALAAQLAPRGKAQGLPDPARQRQRAALGLDDDSCGDRAIGERARPEELAQGLIRSPIAVDIMVTERWVPQTP